MLLLLTSHNSSILSPPLFFLFVCFFLFNASYRSQMSNGSSSWLHGNPLGCSWVSTPGFILAVSYGWSADYFSELSCSSNASSFFLSFSYSGNTWSLKIQPWRNLSCIVYKVCGSKGWPMCALFLLHN